MNINKNNITDRTVQDIDTIGMLLVAIEQTQKVPPAHIMQAAILLLAAVRAELAGSQGFDA